MSTNLNTYNMLLTNDGFHRLLKLLEGEFDGLVNYGATDYGEIYVNLNEHDDVNIVPINFREKISQKIAIIDGKIERAKQPKRKISLLTEKEALLTTLGVIDEIIKQTIEDEVGSKEE